MKIKILCDKDSELNKFKVNIRKEFLKEEVSKKYKIKFVAKSSKDFDICLIISNDLEFVYKNSYEFKSEESCNTGLIILTSNLRSANIIGCLNITPYVYYIKTKIDTIIFKIMRIYERNEKNNLYKVPVKNKKDSQ